MQQGGRRVGVLTGATSNVISSDSELGGREREREGGRERERERLREGERYGVSAHF